MSTTAASILIALEADTKGIKKGLKETEDQVKGSGSVFSGAMSTFFGMGALNLATKGIGMVKDSISGWIDGALQAQSVQNETNRILSSGSHVAGLTSQQVDDLATKYMNLSGVDDDVIHGAENILASFSNIKQNAFPQVTQSALDMARALSVSTGSALDVNGAAKTLGLALQDPAKGARLLRSENITLSDAQQKQIATFMKHGDVAKAQGVIMDAVKQKTQGAAEAYGNTAQGKIDKFHTVLDNTGKNIASQLLPTITDLIGKATDLASNITPFIQWLGDHQPVLIGIGAVIGTVLVAAFISWAIAAGSAAVATIAATWPILLIAAAIGALIAIIVLVVQHWGDITTALGHFKDMLGNVAGKVGEFVGGVLGKIGEFKDMVLGKIGDLIGSVVSFWESLPQKVVTLVLSLRDKVIAKIQDLKDGFKRELEGIRDLVGDIWNKIVGFFKTGVNLAISSVNGMIDNLNRLQIHIPSVTVGPVTTPKFDWNGLHIPHIPMLASGGLIGVGGLAIVGERGPELVNLPTGAQVIPNGQSANLLASRGSSGNGGNTVVYLQLDGKTVARAVIPHIPGEVRLATGKRV